MLLRFDEYMERCLYDPDTGFYASGRGSAGGRRGDFITSPEVGPLFADVVARALDHWWDRLERPDPFIVYDAGTGPGTLARMLQAAPGRSAGARQVVGFDRPTGRPGGAIGPARDLAGAVVIANELLDNLPVRVLERGTDRWSEVHVELDSDQGPIERLRPDDPDRPLSPSALLPDATPGTRVAVHAEADRWVAGVLDAGASVLVAFDYGAPTTAELVERGSWLRTYRNHVVAEDPYVEPGRWDITCDVAFDQLPPPDELIDQARFLRRWGIDGLVEEGRRYWRANAAAPDVGAMRMRSRATEAEALLDPNGLGSWFVASWFRF